MTAPAKPRERGIIFTGPNVMAIMRGTKRQTRRVLPDDLQAQFDKAEAIVRMRPRQRGIGWDEVKTLWVREALHRAPHAFVYSADGVEVPWPARQHVNGLVRETVSPIFMPRAVSRLTLAVTDVRVQRLQEISEEDAVAEGVTRIWSDTLAHCDTGPNHYTVDIGCGSLNAPSAVETYRLLWGVIHGPGAWDRNPFVVAVTFDVVKPEGAAP